MKKAYLVILVSCLTFSLKSFSHHAKKIKIKQSYSEFRFVDCRSKEKAGDYWEYCENPSYQKRYIKNKKLWYISFSDLHQKIKELRKNETISSLAKIKGHFEGYGNDDNHSYFVAFDFASTNLLENLLEEEGVSHLEPLTWIEPVTEPKLSLVPYERNKYFLHASSLMSATYEVFE